MAEYNPTNNGDPIFRDAWEARDSITKSQEREIRHLYNQWAKDIREQARNLSRVPGSLSEQRELVQLYYQLRSASKQLTTEINSSVNHHVTYMGDVVQRVNRAWLASLGFTPESIDRKFSRVKDMAIRNILTGNLYQNGHNLSQRVWKITDGNLKDMYTIMARGIAENQSLYSIAKQLEKYVSPSAKLSWKVSRWSEAGRMRTGIIHNGQVDYNAQRLARTMIQHAYQQTLVGLTRDNPFVRGYIWRADGNHPCGLCLDRNGVFYSAENIPLDHPNGQCTIEVDVDQVEVVQRMADYSMSPEEYQDMVEFFRGLDFRPWGS